MCEEEFTVDSMTEIFYEEALSLINELYNIIEKYKNCPAYDENYIKKVFRVIHTMKADSTMMLIDDIAVPSRVLESLLVFFRNNKIDVEDTERFDKIITTYVKYVSDDVNEFVKGVQLGSGHKDLEDNINNYLEDLKKQYSKDIQNEEHTSSSGSLPSGRRQVYYIPSASESTAKEKKPDAKKAEKAKETAKENKEKSKAIDFFNRQPGFSEEVVMVKQRDIDSLNNSIKHYKNFVQSIEERFAGDRRIEIRHRDLMLLKSIANEISSAAGLLTESDFVAIARKMEALVDEMSVSLKKPVKLLVRGERTLFNKSAREKISSALVHIIRNAVDHGIESIEERERLGKAPMGLVRLNFNKKDGHLIITVEDDGAGIDKDAVLKSAKENNLLKKPEAEYTEDEIINLLFASGVSTTEKPNDYSGRGVGMDVIRHNIASLGGSIKISSNFGYGTKIVMTF